MNAQAAQTAQPEITLTDTGRPEQASTAIGMLNLQMSSTLAGMLDKDDCEDDYAVDLVAAKPRGGVRDTATIRLAKAPVVTNFGDKAQHKLDTTPVILTAAREVKTLTDPKAAPPALATANAVKAIDYVPSLLGDWEIALTDKTLNAAMARWTAIAGWQLLWELPVDYAVEARTTVPGTFEQAVETVAMSMESAEIPMKAIFYKGNKVLRIVPKGSK